MMKQYKPSKMPAITAAQTSGTRFYPITLDRAIEVANKENLILAFLLATQGWSAIKVDELYGSSVIDDILYVCDTDGLEIVTDSGDEVYPEDALQDVGLDELQSYIQQPDAKTIRMFVSTYELKPVDMTDVAYDMLEDGYSFDQIVTAAQDAGFIDND